MESASVFVDVEHPFRGDVEMHLLSPRGTASRLTFRVPSTSLADTRFVPHAYTSLAFLGETTGHPSNSTWLLSLLDHSERGVLRRARVCVRGVAEPPPPLSPPSVSSPPPLDSANGGERWVVVSLVVAAGVALVAASFRCYLARGRRRADSLVEQVRSSPFLEQPWSLRRYRTQEGDDYVVALRYSEPKRLYRNVDDVGYFRDLMSNPSTRLHALEMPPFRSKT